MQRVKKMVGTKRLEGEVKREGKEERETTEIGKPKVNSPPYDLCSLFQSYFAIRLLADPLWRSSRRTGLGDAGKRFARKKDCGL
jgi:hypothetical protein